jgi:hypothetical protein
MQGGRFQVEVSWRDGQGEPRPARLETLSEQTTKIWFFDPDNVELLLKVLDARSFAGAHWVFYGALSDLAYDVTVTDTETGRARRYANAAGSIAGVADTSAFSQP